MNLVGKIFTVLIFVMALVFMSFTVMVYATYKNWKLYADNPKPSLEQPEGLAQQLEKERKAKQTLQDENDRVNKAYTLQKLEDEQSRGKLEERNAQLAELKTKNEDLIKQKDKEIADLAATSKIALERADRANNENDGLRVEIKKAHKERDDNFNKVVELTDQLNNAVNERMQLNERNVQLATDYAKAQEALRWFGINPKADFKAKQPPHPLDGAVVAVPEQNLVEINIGADDGLRKGHKLEVVRMDGGSTSYVGRIEVQQVTPDRAVCRVLPEMLRSPMKRGDRVFDRLD